MAEEATHNDLKSVIKASFTPVESLAELDLPPTTDDLIERLEQSTGFDLDRFEVITELNALGFRKTMVGSECFWLVK
jgi:hypothetical protein